jgi:hypothetical protein
MNKAKKAKVVGLCCSRAAAIAVGAELVAAHELLAGPPREIADGILAGNVTAVATWSGDYFLWPFQEGVAA